MALVAITVAFAAHVVHSVAYFRGTDVYPKILRGVEWLFY